MIEGFFEVWTFETLGFFWVEKIGEHFFWGLDLRRDFLGIQNNLKIQMV